MFTKAEQSDAIARLREMVRKGDVLHVITKSVSRSGMSRKVDVYLFRPDPEAPGGVRSYWLTRLVAKALRWPTGDNGDTLRVDGCGMDMHFHTVYSLSARLFDGDGYAITHNSL